MLFSAVFSKLSHKTLPSVEDEAALDQHIAEAVRLYVIVVAFMMLLFTLVNWALDRHVHLPAHLPAITNARISSILVEVSTLVVFAWLKPRGRAAPMVAMLCYAALAGAVGYWFAQLGSEQAYLVRNSAFGVVPAALIPAEIRIRTIGTSCISTVLFLCYQVTHPVASVRYVDVARGLFFVFAGVLTIAVGELSFRATRTIFLERRDAEKVREELAHLTDHLRTTVRQRTEELRALAQHLESVQENERRRIARDLHDDLGQSMTAMRYTVARLRSKLDGLEDAPSMLLDDLSAILDGTSQTLRAVVATLSPHILEEHGLSAAAEWLTGRIQDTTPIICKLHQTPICDDVWERIHPRIALVAFRVIQEGTTNALKHASAARLDVFLELDDTTVAVAVKDDGDGFNPEQHGSGFGLFGLRERLRNLGGEMSVESVIGKGTTLRATISRRSAAPEASGETIEAMT